MLLKKVFNPTVTVMVPIYNSGSVLAQTLKSLNKQTYPINKIVLVDDCSVDNSLTLAKEFKKKSRFSVKIIAHKINKGLSFGYNEVVNSTKTTYLITLNADCVIADKNGITKLVEPFEKKSLVVESCSYMINPEELWGKYNFWQKCIMSGLSGKKMSGRNSTFCCFSVSALRQIGLFDEYTFRTAGEDGDIISRLEQIGQVIDVNTHVLHLHNQDQNFGLQDLLHKEYQRAESVGAGFAKNGGGSFLNTLRIVLRPVLLIGLVIPKVNLLFIFLIFCYSILYTEKVFRTQWYNPRILILPLINMYLLVSGTYFLTKGFITKKQQL